MKKTILTFAVGQFILAFALIFICLQFRAVTADSEVVEKQFAKQCAALAEALKSANRSY